MTEDSATPLPYACARCGHEQATMDVPCEKCRSVRVVAIFVLRDLFGEDWRDAFKEATS